ncbi:hypothetical protein [Fructilactobacillus fructivorans]|uniref:Uncharacterized protein n=1 Tax=Fructilactobacillus fructivorans TaxID=1614 RepID=A0AAE6TWM9_9LACO|nr:hypothetical protein [Fructilactobacillus fructivorans]KRK57783.1 hypothetical protein FC73_GL000791 [Fructilactobacillus fructivorans]KRN12676.1 hypothetical protein IV37_GL000976 [Fructilactobacillus fructivorans]KRN40660.1 hypothetical protein IV51_GL001281 [Fructilactobacillus fructivorans]KRN43201.1 hypothetical protein IV48_GL000756 [Fructilactobacillus fructivorans]QFX92939.1 hypothetical protein LF543_05025 [Fructilactobacillus fructivorans]
MNNEELNNIVEGRLDKYFEKYPSTPDVEMYKIELKRSIVKDALAKISDEVTINDAINQAFSDFGDIDHAINQVIFKDHGIKD